MKKTMLSLSLICSVFYGLAQSFTYADTLRGADGPGRNWWDATKYDLHVSFDLQDSTITGYNIISYHVLKDDHIHYLQIDLQEPMIIDSVVWNNGNDSTRTPVRFERNGNAWFVYLPRQMKEKEKIKREASKSKKFKRKRSKKNAEGFSEKSTLLEENLTPVIKDYKLTVYYHGKPLKAKHAPWDGGIIWQRDMGNHPWITIACQGLGASVWYPCKDIQSDEPDSAEMHITAPAELTAISNGKLKSKIDNPGGTTTTSWAVVNPINNYDFIPYLGKYVHFGEIYEGEKGRLTMDYWVLDSNLAKAKSQFKDAARMMKAFEYWFGPYPFYEDGYKLVESPHLGMEHQSAIAYGNGYQNGYFGSDLSGSGWGLKWDFIIVHESGHEWFGNNITAKDIADNWIHEGFTNYSETLFTEFYYGKQAAQDYITGIRKNIKNEKPIIGHYGVNEDGPIDIYYKASNMIHTIRQVINNDSLFRQILRGLNEKFYHKTVTSAEVENFISKQSGIDLSKIFEQYLRTIQIPALEYSISNGQLTYRWTNCVKGFNMPLKIMTDESNFKFIYPTDQKQRMPYQADKLIFDPNFYIQTKKIN